MKEKVKARGDGARGEGGEPTAATEHKRKRKGGGCKGTHTRAHICKGKEGSDEDTQAQKWGMAWVESKGVGELAHTCIGGTQMQGQGLQPHTNATARRARARFQGQVCDGTLIQMQENGRKRDATAHKY